MLRQRSPRNTAPRSAERPRGAVHKRVCGLARLHADARVAVDGKVPRPPAHDDLARVGGGAGPAEAGGIRVPLIVKWPGRTPAGAVCDQPVFSCDLFPTLVAMAGLSSQTQPPVDGLDISSLLVIRQASSHPGTCSFTTRTTIPRRRPSAQFARVIGSCLNITKMSMSSCTISHPIPGKCTMWPRTTRNK
ncbi:MAG: hypothetical protein FJ276_01295 [Planctomycetes bacterium]|nr:hypothetical protein [Planctomycetota bacterium]